MGHIIRIVTTLSCQESQGLWDHIMRDAMRAKMFEYGHVFKIDLISSALSSL